jgi:hypothetical protein
MKIKLDYWGTKSYGTRDDVTHYAGKVSGDDERVDLKVFFPNPPSGLSENPDSGAQLRGFSLSFSISEAAQIATALLAFAHHPTSCKEVVRWMPSDEMPNLAASDWEEKLKLETVKSWDYAYECDLANSSSFHFGDVKIEYAVINKTKTEDDVLCVVHNINLSPGHRRRVALNGSDIPRHIGSASISHAKIVEVTGFNLSAL